MNRRSFFKFLPIAPVALVAEGARAATFDGVPENNILTLTPLVRSQTRIKTTQFDIVTPCIPNYKNSVDLSVGKDGRLWVKSKNDGWRRVVTE